MKGCTRLHRAAWAAVAGQADPIHGSTGAVQYGEGWLKITARLTIFPSLMLK